MLLPHDPVNAFLDYPPVEVPSAAEGPLAGLTFAVKDLYDVAGYPTGAGHPLKRSQSDIKTVSAPAVQRILDAGARFVGKTHTDELAYSMNGENFHYGTPVNIRAAGRIPGGSSSGSAAATSAGLVDFALGSDTGGSVRAPASYNGLIGLRPTFGRIDISRVVPLAESFDTVGWFARDADTFARVGDVLLGDDKAGPPLRRFIVGDDIHALLLGDLEEAAVRSASPRIAAHLEPAGAVIVSEDGLTAWRMIFRTLQAYEAWQAHGAWIQQYQPVFGPGIRERFEWASRVTREDYDAADLRRQHVRDRLTELLGDDTVLAIPTTPGIAPLIGLDGDTLESYRNRALSMLCTAGLAGLPQISLPLAEHEGCPLGVSLVAPAGRDRALIELARRIMAG
ncbi:amidase [Kaistia dalseonensis]|uniref:Amidase n=1 Tax=Kaistia dalseonensis TaxID=410840 RepID=A0ABU0HAY1_9HYPH|nr:amidase [Kaistia dalseonensis]MCX5496851.1 amidase [Kaistia dalseonensis]MDQ0439477.1 amidase [Kaistia dalseonensis]